MIPLNVLPVSYSFPPAGGVGVLRAASLALIRLRSTEPSLDLPFTLKKRIKASFDHDDEQRDALTQKVTEYPL
jgi:hypothetical protein